MKKYAIKFIPIPENDYCFNNFHPGDYVYYEKFDLYSTVEKEKIKTVTLKEMPHGGSVFKEDLKRVKPILISHHIKQGEKFINPNNNEEYTATEVISISKEFNISNIYPNGKNALGFTNTEVYKYIAEVSMFVKWLRGREQFDEDEVEFESSSNDKKNKYIEIGDPIFIETDNKLIELQGVVKDFKHKSEGEWDWDDLVVITDAHTPKLDKGGFPKYKIINKKIIPELIKIEDFEIERRHVRFRPTYFKIANLKCDKCDTFH